MSCLQTQRKAATQARKTSVKAPPARRRVGKGAYDRLCGRPVCLHVSVLLCHRLPCRPSTSGEVLHACVVALRCVCKHDLPSNKEKRGAYDRVTRSHASKQGLAVFCSAVLDNRLRPAAPQPQCDSYA